MHRTPAAVHVVHAIDARASGYLSVMESLREVPGMHVSLCRHGLFLHASTTLLCEQTTSTGDGVEAYSPVFSGVHWDLVDHFLKFSRESIVRDWCNALGSNAVNGVINILTEEAADLQVAKLRWALGMN